MITAEELLAMEGKLRLAVEEGRRLQIENARLNTELLAERDKNRVLQARLCRDDIGSATQKTAEHRCFECDIVKLCRMYNDSGVYWMCDPCHERDLAKPANEALSVWEPTRYAAGQ